MLPYANLIALLAFYICNLLIFWTGWHTVSRMMIVLAIGFIFFVIYCFKEKNTWQQQWQTAWWLIPYFIALSIISYLGTFGEGNNLIPFGIDFIVIGILSIIVFFIALISSKKRD